MLPEEIRDGFGAVGEPDILCAGSSTVRIGDLVIKKLDPTSLENDRSFELATWLGDILSAVSGSGFRLARPVRASTGCWILGDGWTASRYVSGWRLGDTMVLGVFEEDPHLGQLLLRASIRMLLIVSELAGVDEWRTEKRAAELVLSYMDRHAG
jgi:hypothetical protein